MAAPVEFLSNIVRGTWKHKAPVGMVATVLILTQAASFLGESRRIDPSSIPGTPQPTPGLDGSGGGGAGLEP